MHDIEPYYHWLDNYTACEDERSPFYGREYDQFMFTQKIYNYYIHPQWDSFGSSTLYMKILFADYDDQFAIIELIGEWNDCLNNDIMFLKREVIDHLTREGIHKFILICENVLNFHGGDNDYYEEWFDDIADGQGWICFVNLLQHVEDEMNQSELSYYIHFGGIFNEVDWRKQKPRSTMLALDKIISNSQAFHLP